MCLSTYEARFIFCRCFASLILNKQRGKREKVCARQLVIKNEMKLPSRKGEVRSLKKKKKRARETSSFTSTETPSQLRKTPCSKKR